jgi:hypothetical protein
MSMSANFIPALAQKGIDRACTQQAAALRIR